MYPLVSVTLLLGSFNIQSMEPATLVLPKFRAQMPRACTERQLLGMRICSLFHSGESSSTVQPCSIVPRQLFLARSFLHTKRQAHLPLSYLPRMHLMFLGNLINCLFASHRFKGYLGFELGGEGSSLVCHLSFSLVIGERLEWLKI